MALPCGCIAMKRLWMTRRGSYLHREVVSRMSVSFIVLIASDSALGGLASCRIALLADAVDWPDQELVRDQLLHEVNGCLDHGHFPSLHSHCQDMHELCRLQEESCQNPTASHIHPWQNSRCNAPQHISRAQQLVDMSTAWLRLRRYFVVGFTMWRGIWTLHAELDNRNPLYTCLYHDHQNHLAFQQQAEQLLSTHSSGS